MVIATQNPIEMEGTYPLPEAQRDRFMARVSMGYPERRRPSWRCSTRTAALDPLDDLEPVADATEIARADRRRSATVHVVRRRSSRYAVDLVTATRSSPELRLGASPRATLHLIRAARAAAALDGRDYVLPDDVQDLAVAGARPPAAAHRRGADRPAVRPRTSWPTSWPGAAARRAHAPGDAERRLSARRAARADHPRALVPRRRAWPRAGRALVARPAGPAAGRRSCCSRCRWSARWWWRAPATGCRRAAASSPAAPPAGQETAVTLRLENISRLPTGLLLVEDQVPYVLGSRPAVRARPGRAARPPRGDLPGPLRRARPLQPRPAVDPADRPVRHVRAAAVVHRHATPSS